MMQIRKYTDDIDNKYIIAFQNKIYCMKLTPDIINKLKGRIMLGVEEPMKVTAECILTIIVPHTRVQFVYQITCGDKNIIIRVRHHGANTWSIIPSIS